MTNMAAKFPTDFFTFRYLHWTWSKAPSSSSFRNLANSKNSSNSSSSCQPPTAAAATAARPRRRLPGSRGTPATQAEGALEAGNGRTGSQRRCCAPRPREGEVSWARRVSIAGPESCPRRGAPAPPASAGRCAAPRWPRCVTLPDRTFDNFIV